MDISYGCILKGMKGVCELCGHTRRLNWDHDHDTDEVRGRLCGACNQALGIFGDTAEGIERVLAYLNRPRTGLTMAEVRRKQRFDFTQRWRAACPDLKGYRHQEYLRRKARQAM
jgi:hypothetical protein